MMPPAQRGSSRPQAPPAASSAAHHAFPASLHERAIDLAFDSFFDDFMRAGPSSVPQPPLRAPSPPRRFEALSALVAAPQPHLRPPSPPRRFEALSALSAVPMRLRPAPPAPQHELWLDPSLRAEPLAGTDEGRIAARSTPLPLPLPPPLAEGTAPAASQLHPWAPPDSLKQEPRSVSPSFSLAEEAAALAPPREYDASLADDERGLLVPVNAGPPLSPQMHVCVARLGGQWTQHLAQRMPPYHDGTAIVSLPEPPEVEYPPPTVLSYRALLRRQARAREVHMPADLRRMWMLRVAHHRGAIPPPPHGSGRVILRRNLPGRKILR